MNYLAISRLFFTRKYFLKIKRNLFSFSSLPFGPVKLLAHLLKSTFAPSTLRAFVPSPPALADPAHLLYSAAQLPKSANPPPPRFSSAHRSFPVGPHLGRSSPSAPAGPPRSPSGSSQRRPPLGLSTPRRSYRACPGLQRRIPF
jgi:hypothetical protein